LAGHQWLTPVILPIQEAETRRMAIQSQLRQKKKKKKKSQTLISKIPTQKRAGRVAQVVELCLASVTP
jgi:hypothetical protein